ncbi:hypothetical protein [Roseibium sp.]|uniref:hypothetical protein n=1 Tax=Roseibium sp. TaxID=1936156 RepID=UPI003BAD90DF
MTSKKAKVYLSLLTLINVGCVVAYQGLNGIIKVVIIVAAIAALSMAFASLIRAKETAKKPEPFEDAGDYGDQ